MLDQALRKFMRVDDVLASAGASDFIRGLLEPPDEAIAAIVGDLRGEWAIDPHLGTVLANAVAARGRQSVLEFGAGDSSVLFATALAAVGGGKLTSIEQDPTWCADQWARVQDFASVDALLVPSTPERCIGRIGWFYSHDDASATISNRAPYDLVLVDAPQHYLGRGGAMPLVYSHLADGALIIMDDAQRPGEQWAIAHWLQAYPSLHLEYYDVGFGKKGLAILSKRGAAAPSFSPRSFAIGLWQGYWQEHLNRDRPE